MSNTIAFGEHSVAILNPADRKSGTCGLRAGPPTPSVTTFYPMNPQFVTPNLTEQFPGLRADGIEPASRRRQFRISGWFGSVPEEFHQLLADESLNGTAHRCDPWLRSWPPFQLSPGTRPGVYQALSTRNWGEVISADSY